MTHFEIKIGLLREAESRFGLLGNAILSQKATFSRFSANSSTHPNRSSEIHPSQKVVLQGGRENRKLILAGAPEF